MFLAAACADVLSRALGAITQFNALRDHTPLEASTEFGAAFALACSDTTQRLTVQRALNLSQRYGLITDNVERMTEAAFDKAQTRLQPRRKRLPIQPSYRRCEGDVSAGVAADGPSESNDAVTAIPAGAMHRFTMTAAAAELGACGFGLTVAQTARDSFEGMLASLLALHAFSAMCARGMGIDLAPVPQAACDPLAPIKHWMREHGQHALSVEEVALKGSEAVLTQADARTRVAEIAAKCRAACPAALKRLLTPAQAASFETATKPSRMTARNRKDHLGSLLVDLENSVLGSTDRALKSKVQAAASLVHMTIDELGRGGEVVLVVARNAPCSPLAIIVGVATRDAASGVWGVADGNLLLVQVRGRRSSEATDEPLGGDMCCAPSADAGVEAYVVLHGDAANEAGERPSNVLAVTSANRDAAFYPTSWGDQRFFAGLHVSRAPHVHRSR